MQYWTQNEHLINKMLLFITSLTFHIRHLILNISYIQIVYLWKQFFFYFILFVCLSILDEPLWITFGIETFPKFLLSVIEFGAIFSKSWLIKPLANTTPITQDVQNSDSDEIKLSPHPIAHKTVCVCVIDSLNWSICFAMTHTLVPQSIFIDFNRVTFLNVYGPSQAVWVIIG